MGILEGKVAVVTGAGRGLGRSHALTLAAEGAAVVVNDPGVTLDGLPSEERPADAVVAEIHAAGGNAIANYTDCADWQGGQSLIDDAITNFDGFDVLVNNAGIIRDRMSFNMAEEEFDEVVRVHLKGHFVPSRHAAHHWRTKAKSGEAISGRIINTTSEAAFWGNPGQTNYGAAKGGIASMTLIMARELQAIGVTVNAISPRGRTRFTPGHEAPTDGSFDPMAVENVSPLVAYLASDETADITGQVFLCRGGYLALAQGWGPVTALEKDSAWTLKDIPGGFEQLFEKHSKVPQDLAAALAGK